MLLASDDSVQVPLSADIAWSIMMILLVVHVIALGYMVWTEHKEGFSVTSVLWIVLEVLVPVIPFVLWYLLRKRAAKVTGR